jgi:hypothetical protein
MPFNTLANQSFQDGRLETPLGSPFGIQVAHMDANFHRLNGMGYFYTRAGGCLSGTILARLLRREFWPGLRLQNRFVRHSTEARWEDKILDARFARLWDKQFLQTIPPFEIWVVRA